MKHKAKICEGFDNDGKYGNFKKCRNTATKKRNLPRTVQKLCSLHFDKYTFGGTLA